MLKKEIIAVITAVFLTAAVCACRSAHAGIPDSERNALSDIYTFTGGPGWTDSTGWNGSPGTECGWHGVTCDAAGSNVTKIELVMNSLRGTIPESVRNFTKLHAVNLSYNDLEGVIPASFGEIRTLRALDLGVNSLSGTIPPELGNIPFLGYLFLHVNSLTGPVPPELGNLADLRLLKLSANRLKGVIPPELGNLAKLRYLTLHMNHLEGPVPPELGNLTNLRELNLLGNSLSGPIPPELANLANLTPGKSDFRWNALYAANKELGTFLSRAQQGGDWETTQTLAPAGISAGTPTPVSVPLAWTAVSAADEYEIVYSAESGGPYTVYGTVTGTETEVTGMAAGRTWYFRVRSVTRAHERNPGTLRSAYSAEISVAVGPEYPGEGPVIEIHSPVPGAYVTKKPVIVSGTASSGTDIRTVTVGGREARLSGSGRLVFFRYELIFQDGDQVRTDVTATDNAGRSASVPLAVTYDSTPPVITLTSPELRPAPAVSHVTEMPYSVAGTVTDKNLAGISVESRSASITRTEPGTWSFSENVVLAAGEERLIKAEAWDLARNRTVLEIILKSDSLATIEMISPREGSDHPGSGNETEIRLVVRVTGAPSGATAKAVADQGTPQQISLNAAGIANGKFISPAADGEHELILSIISSDGTVIARTATHYTVTNPGSAPLRIEKQKPANGEKNAEPNDVIQFYFSRPAQKSELGVTVKETVHGNHYEYDSENQKKAGITLKSSFGIIEVHRDMETVDGRLSVLPGGRIAEFCPDRDYAFGSRVSVEVTYGGAELSRSQFTVRELPTFVSGKVCDQHGNAVAGIQVSLSDPDRTTVTDSSGAFSFECPAEKMPPSNRYRLVINPNLKNRSFGVSEFWADVEQGRMNQAGVLNIPLLSSEPFRRIRTRQPEPAVLAGGSLELDLSEAELMFPDGRDYGDVHVRAESADNIPFGPVPGVVPHWMFAVQPSGTKVSGPVKMVFKIPALNDSYYYMPKNGTPAVLVASDAKFKRLIPAGVGRVRDRRVISEGEVRLSCLDFVGYAFVWPEQYALLEEYLENRIPLQLLTGKLADGKKE